MAYGEHEMIVRINGGCEAGTAYFSAVRTSHKKNSSKVSEVQFGTRRASKVKRNQRKGDTL